MRDLGSGLVMREIERERECVCALLSERVI